MMLNRIYKDGRLLVEIDNTITFSGYGHYIYVVTNNITFKRYIGYHKGYPTDIYDNITDRSILEDIYKIGKDKFTIGIAGKYANDTFIEDHMNIEIRRYLPGGVYNKGYGVTDNSVICLDTNKMFNSAGIAGKYYDIDSSTIRKVCKGDRKTAGGYRWMYYKDYISK